MTLEVQTNTVMDGTAGKGFFDFSTVVNASNLERRVLLTNVAVNIDDGVGFSTCLFAMAASLADVADRKGIALPFQTSGSSNEWATVSRLHLVPTAWSLFIFCTYAGGPFDVHAVVGSRIVTERHARAF